MGELVQLKISQLENVKTKEEVRGARLLDKEYLEALSLSWEENSTSLQPEAAKDVLEGLQPHHDLKSLEITGYGGATSPTWLSSTLSVTSLQILHLENCREWKILRSTEMSSLRKLTLIRMLNLKEISVPSLEELTLIDMPKLEKCIGSYGMELTSSLRVLMIKNCPQLNEFTLFQSYSSFDAEQKSWFTSLSKLSIGQCPHIMNNWPILPLREMRALKKLELMDLHVLRVSVPSLEKLVLIKMPILEFCGSLTTSPRLQFLPSQGDKKEWTSNLRRLTILDCPCLIVSHPLPPSGLIYELSIIGVPTLPAMRVIQRRFIIQSNELCVLDDSILAFHNLRGITSFIIWKCPNLVCFSSEAFSQLIALEDLFINNCPNLTMSSIMAEVLEGNCRSTSSLVLPSLKNLDIARCGVTGRWLTQMLSRSPSLENLRLTDCPQIKFLSISQPRETEGTSSLGSAVMTSTQDEQELKLPYNLLCSLKRLRIDDIPDLEFCGDNRDFAGFTSLTNLMLHDCPKLVSSLVGETNDDGTMEVGLLPPSLEDLSIRPLPENLQSFTPQGLLHLKKLSLSNSSCLKYLQLHSCTALEQLEISGCVQLAVLEGSQFLCSLKISGCVQLAALEGLQFLGFLRISGCVQLAVLEGMQFLTSLRWLFIELNPELSYAWVLKLEEQEQGGNQIQLFPSSLETLEIQKLTDRVQSRLLSRLPAITELAIKNSPELTSLQLGCCTALKELEIGHCSSLASIEGLQFCRNLTKIAIQESPELTSLQLAYCTALKELEIGHCSSLASIEGLQFCRDLTSLKVFNSPGLGSCLELVSHQQGASGIWSGLETLEIDDASVLSTPFCKQLTSLRHLQFSSRGLVSLTEEQETALQLLTSLQKLEFSMCTDLLSLPANLHRLTSLQTLSINDCLSITRLPDMGLPHSLTYLQLSGCNEEFGMQCRMAATEKLRVNIW